MVASAARRIALAVLIVAGCGSGSDAENVRPDLCVQAERLRGDLAARPAPDFGTIYATRRVVMIVSAESAGLSSMALEAPAPLRPAIDDLAAYYQDVTDDVAQRAGAAGSERSAAQGLLAERLRDERSEVGPILEEVRSGVERECDILLPELSVEWLEGPASEYLPASVEGQLAAVACRGATKLVIHTLPPAWNARGIGEALARIDDLDPDCEGLTILARLATERGSAGTDLAVVPPWYLVDIRLPHLVRGWTWLGEGCGSAGPTQDFPVCWVESDLAAGISAGAAVEAALEALPVLEIAPIASEGTVDLDVRGLSIDLSGSPCYEPGSLAGGGVGGVELRNLGTAATPASIDLLTSAGTEVLTLHRGLEPGESIDIFPPLGAVRVDPDDKIVESDESNNEDFASQQSLFICQ